jgi:lactate permease
MFYLAVILPFVVLLVTTLVFRRPLWQSAVLSLGFSIILWLQTPGIRFDSLVIPGLRALILSCEVALILFGAITFLEYMQRIGTTQKIRESLAQFTGGSPGIEALLLAWLFCGFLEGAAGFGAPAAIVAPLLMALGFPPLIAAVLPLIGDSAAVPFGAVGTPVRIGFAGIEAPHAALYGAAINIIAGLVAPLVIFQLASRYATKSSQDKPKKPGSLWLAAWAGLCFTVPAFGLAWIGPEFPSLAGSMIGLFVFCMTLWGLCARDRVDEKPSGTIAKPLLNLIKAFGPYFLVCVLLLTGKIFLGSLNLELRLSGQVQKIGMFQPGLVFLLAIALYAITRKEWTWSEFKSLGSTAVQRLPRVWGAVFCMAGLAQLIIHSVSAGGIAPGFSTDPGAGLAFMILAPLGGAMGAFVAGSATVSNLLMTPFLAPAASGLEVDFGLILGLQLVGAGAGNMISLQNLAAVQATVGLVDQERAMLKLLWWPCALYVILAILVAMVLSL